MKKEEKRAGCLPFFLRFLATPADKADQQDTEEPPESLELDYTLKKTLLTSAETLFYNRILEAVGNKLTVFAQVRVADVVEVKKGANWNKLFPKISQKHFDFVLCRPRSLEILAAIELDDSSHSQKKRQERDQFLNKACQAAGLNLIRVVASNNYDPKKLRAKIQDAIAGRP